MKKIKLFTIALFFTAFSFAVLPAYGEDWPTLAYDIKRSGSSPEQVNPPYTNKWMRDFYDVQIAQNEGRQPEMIWSSVVVANRLVYLGTSHNNVYALDENSGQTVWSYNLSASGSVLNSPTISNGTVYVASTDGYLYALDATGNPQNKTTTLKWKYSISRAGIGFRTSPAVTQSRVYLGSMDSYFYAFDINDCEARYGQSDFYNPGVCLEWRYKTDAHILNTAAVDNQNNASENDDVVYFGSDDMHAYALNYNGGLIWKSAKLPGASMKTYWPVVIDDFVVFRTSPSMNAGNMLDCGDGAIWQVRDLAWPDCNKVYTWSPPPGHDDLAVPMSGDITREQDAIIARFNKDRDQQTFFALKKYDGTEKFKAPVLWTNWDGEPGDPPLLTPDGRVFTYLRSYWSDHDGGAIWYDYSVIGEIDKTTGRIKVLNLANYNGGNAYWNYGLAGIGDESHMISISGDTVYVSTICNIAGIKIPAQDIIAGEVMEGQAFKVRPQVAREGNCGLTRTMPFGVAAQTHSGPVTPHAGGNLHPAIVANKTIYRVNAGIVIAVQGS